MSAATVAIIDYHPILLEGVADLLRNKHGLSVVATGCSAGDIDVIIRNYCPQILIIDFNMPGNPLAEISRATKTAPETKIIVFSASTDFHQAMTSLDAGASGYVLKCHSTRELFSAITSVLDGVIYITPSISNQIIEFLKSNKIPKFPNLSNITISVRETQIIKLLLCGKKNSEIGRELLLSEKTIKNYMTNLMQKLHVRNRLEVIIAAKNIIELQTIVSAPLIQAVVAL